MGVALALGGGGFMIQHHNQPNSWWSGRGDARVEARGGGEHLRGHRPIVWTIKLIDNKIQKNAYWPKMAADSKFYIQQPPKTCGNSLGGNG
jgi:hypothetical protein